MGEGTLNKEGYKDLIKEDIELVEKYIPKERFMRSHIIMVLKWSIEQLYPDMGKSKNINETLRNLDVSSKAFEEELDRLAVWLRSEEGQKAISNSQSTVGHIEEIISDMKNIRNSDLTQPYNK